MVKLFNTNNYFVLVYLPFIIFLIGGYSIFISTCEISFGVEKYSFITYLINFGFIPHWLVKSLIFLLIFLQAILFNNATVNHEFLRSNYISSLTYVLSFLLIPEIFCSFYEVISLFFFLLFLYNIIVLTKETSTLDNVFSTGFFLSLSVIFYFPMIYNIIVLVIAIWLIRVDFFKEILISLSAFLIPILFIITCLFWFDKLIVIEKFFSDFDANFNLSLFRELLNPLDILNIIISILLLIYNLEKLYKMNIASRRITVLFFWLLIIGVFAMFTYGYKKTYSIVLLIPFSYLLTFYFVTTRNKILTNILFYFILIQAFYQQMFRYLNIADYIQF